MFFPFKLRQPVLICVNFSFRKIEVIHPMRPQAFDFSCYVRTVRSFILNEMTAKSARFKSVQFFKCEEIVPKSQAIDFVDDGIYLMHYMKVYACDRKKLTSFISNSRAADKLFKLKLKYCYTILSCDQNELNAQILSDARRLNIRFGKQAVEPETSYTDNQLLDYVFSASKGDEAKFDVVVQTTFGCATKKGMASLRPRKWVKDMVIDMFGLYSTLLSPDLLYIPTTASSLDPTRDNKLGRNYINMSYMPKDGSSVKAVSLLLFLFFSLSLFVINGSPLTQLFYSCLSLLFVMSISLCACVIWR